MANEKQFTVNMTKSALTDFVFRSYYGRFSGWISIFLGLLGIALIIMTWGKASNQTLGCYIAVAAICLVLNPIILYYKAGVQLKQNPSYKSSITYVIGVDKLTVKQGTVSQDVKWSEVYRLRYSKQMLAVYTNAVHAFVIPVSELGNDKDAIVTRIVQYTQPHKPHISPNLKEFLNHD